MNQLRAFFASRLGRLILHDAALALGTGLAAWEAAGRSWAWGAIVAAAVVAGKAFLRLILPVPALRQGNLQPEWISNNKQDFYEDDEPVAKVVAAFEAGEHGFTGPVGTFTTTGSGSYTYNPAVTIQGVYVGATTTAHDRLTFLPERSARKGGMLPSPRDDRDYQAKLPATIPTAVDYGAGITWGMLLNDRLGDCYPAALLHALQVLTGYTPVDADALAVYEQVTGYDPTKTRADGSNPTDQGTYGRQLYDWARKQGLIASYAAVPANRTAVKAAIAAHKTVLCEWALPVGAETEGDIWTMPRAGRAAGSWGGHATVETGYTRTRNRNVTWGEYGTVTPSFEDAYLTAAWVVTVKPGTDVAAIMAKVRAA